MSNRNIRMGWIMSNKNIKIGWIMSNRNIKIGWIMSNRNIRIGWIMSNRNKRHMSNRDVDTLKYAKLGRQVGRVGACKVGRKDGLEHVKYRDVKTGWSMSSRDLKTG